jgi:hypothetical protein
MWKINARLGVLAAIFVGIPLRLLAQQETGAVEVVVNDQQGAGIAGAGIAGAQIEVVLRPENSAQKFKTHKPPASVSLLESYSGVLLETLLAKANAPVGKESRK